ncbi:MAG: hypothetical protein M1334_04975 [Patescibacteria group bacterium]|nr:hypothetical protein [Patescibacteria group bacterium]
MPAEKENKKGQLLIETLVALGILTTGFLGILGLLSRSLSLNRVVSEQYQANYLAAEGIEIVKHVADQNIEKGYAFNYDLNDGCYEVAYDGSASLSGSDVSPSYKKIESLCPSPKDALGDATINNLNLYTGSGFYGYNTLNVDQTSFKRYVQITNASNEIEVDSYVVWISRGGGQFNVHLKDDFYNWRPNSGI